MFFIPFVFRIWVYLQVYDITRFFAGIKYFRVISLFDKLNAADVSVMD